GLGLLAQFGLRNGYLNPPVALALLVTLSVTAFITLTNFTALAIEQREKELRAQHQLLHRSEARISAILAIAADAIISVDHQQRITLFNEWAEKI
ncbi:hypothetical protein MXD81_19765, partial [Microbacteriaceae bacterium K1510]|nr:hypothetical protein [Microbacteriaceae bacterium K1510]